MTGHSAMEDRAPNTAPVPEDAAARIGADGQDAELDAELAAAAGNSETAVRLLLVIDPRALTRQSLTEMLARGLPDHRIVAVPSCEELLNGSDKPELTPGVILLKPGTGGARGAWARGAIQWLTLWLPGAPVMVVSDGDDAEDVEELLALGVRGYLPTSADPEVAFAAVRLVYAGGMYIPGQLFRKVAARNGAAALGVQATRRAEQPATPDLTPRELAVTDLLRKGKPNKVIGIELGMQESTVKVHVRNIMRKLQAANRTQAALAADHLLVRTGEK